LSLDRLLILPDVHRPYHDPKAWSLMIKVGREFKPHRIIILGDFIDGYCVSSHGGRAPNREHLLEQEIGDGNVGLDQIAALGAKRVDFIEGNHEDRVRRYIADKCPELFGLVSVRKLLRVDERGWYWTPYRKSLKVGSVHFTHDVGKAGQGAAAKTRDVFGGNAVIGHVHRMECSYVGNLKGDVHVGMSLGWLGSADAVDYMASPAVARSWTHGVGLGVHDTTSGLVYLTPAPFVRGTALVNGKVVRL
jgi:hypothetical protein